jgi:hypothetical protein
LPENSLSFALSEIWERFPDSVTDLRKCHFCFSRSGKLSQIRARFRCFWRFSASRVTLCAVHFGQAHHESKSPVMLLGTSRHCHQFVRSRHKFLKFPRRSENRRFQMLEHWFHNCEFWKFCTVYQQTELIYLWRKLNPKIELEKASMIANFAGYSSFESLTADRMFALANAPKLQRSLLNLLSILMTNQN